MGIGLPFETRTDCEVHYQKMKNYKPKVIKTPVKRKMSNVWVFQIKEVKQSQAKLF